MRKRDRLLAENLISVVTETGNLDDAAKVEALRRSWIHAPRNPRRAVAIVDAKLRNPEMRELVHDLFKEGGDFTMLDAIKLHVAHIRGEIETEKMFETRDGRQVVRVRKGPSWPALKAYMDMVLPRRE